MSKRLILPLICLLFGIRPVYGADPSALIQTLDNSTRAVSIVDLLSKAGVDAQGNARILAVPRLKIINQCAKCALSNALRLLMIGSYQDVANKYQLKIQTDKTVTLAIDGINERNNLLRGFLGVLSGADYIQAHVKEHPDQSILEYAVSHEEGVALVAQRVGERAIQQVIQAELDALNAQNQPEDQSIKQPISPAVSSTSQSTSD